MYTTENIIPGSRTLTVLIHGQGGSRREWMEKDGFTKGGNLTEALSARGCSWVACDLYGHGEWTADEPGFDPDNVDDEVWDKLVSLSLESIRKNVNDICGREPVERINLVTYSAGSVIGAKLLAETLPLPVAAVLMAAPTPQKEFDDGYSLHNNLEAFKGLRVFLYSGIEDEEVPLEEVRWLFDQIRTEDRKLREYKAGHSLPAGWVEDALTDLFA